MARSVAFSLSRKSLDSIPFTASSRFLSLRTQSTEHQPDPSDTDASSPSDPLFQKLEEAVHRIMVRRSAPDWLPFLPGSSYWVPPPRSQTHSIAQVLEKLANPLSPEEALSTTTERGWPSSDYFIKGVHPKEVDPIPKSSSSSEDEEG